MKSKILLALTLSLGLSATVCAADDSGKTNQKTHTYTNEDVWAAYEGFNSTLLDSNKYIYKTNSSYPSAVDRGNGAAAIWCQPIYWDMAMNAYKLAKAQKNKEKIAYYKTLSEKIFAGNKAQYCHFDFDDNNENTGWFIYDDIQWWTITLARAYQLFGNDEYLKLSEASFKRVWYGSEKVGDTGSYDKENGGMFWQWQPIRNPNPNKPGDGKMACINFPTVVAALTLSNNVPKNRKESTDARPDYQTKAQYLAKGKEIYEWGVENLLDKASGKIADSRHGNGNPAWKAHVYNQATFIGASVLLYKATGEKRYLDNAILGADYTVNVMSAEHNLLPFEGGIEQGIYTAIFAEYIAMLVYDCGQTQYIPFLKHTIECGWANRDKTRNVCGGEYHKKLPAGAEIDSYSASGIPALMLLFPASRQTYAQQPDKKEAKTTFQTAEPWKPETDVRADATMVYGTLDKEGISFEQRVHSWRDKGYQTQFMTGVAWGDYKDYFLGKWDGIDGHLKEGQRDRNGNEIAHGHLIPYIVPTESFIRYMQETQIKRVIDAGITSIYLEEPEFWMRGGYSEAFKSEWQKYYNFPWRAQHESPENTYLSNKLKYHLYYNALDKIFTYAKEYGKSKGLDIKCYVPTHSLINYTAWEIVSPEASLASLDCVDGYIAQVWTGTAREANYYNGIVKERVFESAFLEYGCMESMTAPLNRKMYFLTDPIEDRAKDWLDYKINYQATFAAQLMYPMVDTYEVMPWPDRIYQGLYRIAGTDKEERIPRSYSTQMQTMINTLNDIRTSDKQISGTHGIGVLMANSLMFQRFPNHNGYDDPRFSSFYGQTLPLLKRGIPVELVHMENTPFKETFKGLQVLVMSYSNMKPMKPEYHNYLADWVKKGGTLVYCGEDVDPYQTVLEWWNTEGNTYKAPSEHLFETMGLSRNPDNGTYPCGKGTLIVMREDPKHFVLKAGNDRSYFETIASAYQKKTGKNVETKNNFIVERGPYTIAAVLDENSSKEPLKLSGLYIDLFDKDLPVLTVKQIQPGEQGYLYDLSKVSGKVKAKVLCGASRIYNEKVGKRSYSFIAKSPLNTTNVSRILLPGKPVTVQVNGKAEQPEWDESSKTLLLSFENDPAGVNVLIEW